MKKRFRLLSLLLAFTAAFLPVSAEEPPYTTDETFPLTSDYVYLIDIRHDQLLYALNGTERMYPASMTKLMTALVVMDQNPDLDVPVLITNEMWAGLIEANASVAGFWPGDEPTVRELLYGLLLPSGADAANALAMHLFGSTQGCVNAMNETAARLAMNDTQFTNITGLHDADHYSTTHDIALLMKAFLAREDLAEILSAAEYTTRPLASAPDGLKLKSTSTIYINRGDDSFSIPGYRGGKTGYTDPAGRCLASGASDEEMDLVLVTGHSEGLGPLKDAETLYNWFFDHYSYRTLLTEGTVLREEIKVIDTLPAVSFSIEAPDTVALDLPDEAEIEVIPDLPDTLQAPVAAGDTIGNVKVYADGQLLYERSLVSPIEAKYSTIAHVLRRLNEFRIAHPILFWIPLTLLFVLIVTLLGAVIARIRSNRRRRRRKRRKVNR